MAKLIDNLSQKPYPTQPVIGVKEELFDLGTVRYVTKMLGSDAKTAAPKARQLQKK